MKRRIFETFGFFGLLAVIGVAGFTITFSPCDTPLTYHISSVDARFNISSDEFAKDIQQSVAIWNTLEGKQLFIYDPKGKIGVSLFYDQRQQLTNQINSLQNQVDSQKGTIEQQITQYEADKAAFEKQVNDLNAQIQYWNQKGGAPKDVFDKLVGEQQALKEQAALLNQRAKSLNQSTVSYNSGIGQLNQTINAFNTSLSFKPEEGLYNSADNSVTIYFANSHNELIHTLTHEMGHEIGLDHNQNQNSIMFPYSTSSITPTADDKAALDAICEKKNLVTIAEKRVELLSQILKQKYFTQLQTQ